MKIVLINPSINKEKYGKVHMFMEPMPCIGLAYVAAVLERDGHEVHVLDNYVLEFNVAKLLEEIAKLECSNPNAVELHKTPFASLAHELVHKGRLELFENKLIQ